MKLALALVLAACGSKSEQAPAIKPVPKPDAASAAIEATDLTLEENHGCLRALDGTVKCWGRNVGGEVGRASCRERVLCVV